MKTRIFKFHCILLVGIFLISEATAQQWQPVGPIAFTPNSVKYTTIAINKNGEPYVAFQDKEFYGQLSVMKYTGNEWIMLGDSGVSTSDAAYISMAFNKNGEPFVALSDGGYGVASVRTFDGSTWVEVGSTSVTTS